LDALTIALTAQKKRVWGRGPKLQPGNGPKPN
jgi:hypothetical protein